ncbi:MAG: hypothetical protein EBR05_11580, partial [Marivivens sp.]|nr:hypothetical protein [Marivivens sp.]
IDLSGAARSNSQYGSGTNEEIRKILGTFDDFILTSLSLQNNGQNFVEKKQSERKKILSQFMGIDLFEKLYDIARDDVADERAYLKRIKEKRVFEVMGRIEQKLKDLEESKSEVKSQIEPVQNDIEDYKSKIDELRPKLKDVDDIKELDFRQLISDNEQKLEEQESLLASENEYREQLRPLYNQVFDKIKGFDEDKLNNDYIDFQKVRETKSKQESQIKLIDGNIDNLKTKLSELEKYKYDENCDFCLENGDHQIKQKKDCETLLQKQKEEMKTIMSRYDLTMIDYERLENIEEEKQKYDDLKDDLKQVEGDAYKTHAKIKELELSVEQVQSTLKRIMKDQELFLDNASAIAYNRNITHKIDKYENQVRIGSEILTEHKKELKKIESDILIEETNKKNLGEEIKDLVEAEQKVSDYEVYLRLVSSDGIPQLIINDALPIIENEVNAVLDHMMAGFQLGITSEQKSINLYIRYDDQEWPLS